MNKKTKYITKVECFRCGTTEAVEVDDPNDCVYVEDALRELGWVIKRKFLGGCEYYCPDCWQVKHALAH